MYLSSFKISISLYFSYLILNIFFSFPYFSFYESNIFFYFNVLIFFLKYRFSLFCYFFYFPYSKIDKHFCKSFFEFRPGIIFRKLFHQFILSTVFDAHFYYNIFLSFFSSLNFSLFSRCIYSIFPNIFSHYLLLRIFFFYELFFSFISRGIFFFFFSFLKLFVFCSFLFIIVFISFIKLVHFHLSVYLTIYLSKCASFYLNITICWMFLSSST